MAAPKKGEKASKNTSCSEETVFMFRPSNLRCTVCPFVLILDARLSFYSLAESDGVGREGKRLLVKNAERKWRPSVIAIENNQEIQQQNSPSGVRSWLGG